MIDEIKVNFSGHIQTLEKSYSFLEHQCKVKDTKIKELIRRQNAPPDIEELRNENQYLQLNILNLENQIHQLQEKINKNSLEMKEMKRNSHRRNSIDKEVGEE